MKNSERKQEMPKPQLKYSKIEIDGKQYSISGWVNTKYNDERVEAHQAKNEVISLINKFDLSIGFQVQRREESLSPSEWPQAGKFSVYRNEYGDHAKPIGDASRNVVAETPKPKVEDDVNWDDV